MIDDPEREMHLEHNAVCGLVDDQDVEDDAEPRDSASAQNSIR